MAQGNDFDKISEWAKKMGERGIYNQSTADSRIGSLKNFMTILSDNEPKDAQSLLNSLDDIATRWAVKTNANPTSMPSFKSRVRVLLQDYLKYQQDPSSLKPRARGQKAQNSVKPTMKKAARKVAAKKAAPVDPSKPLDVPTPPETPTGPSLHIDIQIHISSDAKSDQIDQIFKSMAKHLYGKKS